MKLLFAACIALSFLGFAESACLCSNSSSYDSSVASVIINGPSTTGGFGGTSCGPINCSTTITFTGQLGNGLAAGAQITILQCSGLNSDNTVKLEATNQTFTSCPSGTYKFVVTSTNVFNFIFNVKTGINMTIVLQPVPQVPTTVAPTLPPTTPSYEGPFKPYDPALSRLDLTIGLDTNMANQQYFNDSSQVIKNIVQYFTYSADRVRLSFMTFDPYAVSGIGKYPLWTHNATTITTELASMPYFAGNMSDYYTLLKTNYFDNIAANFSFRNNTERVFIIFTGTDSMPNAEFDKIKETIDKYDVKFIFVNMNPTISTPNNNYYNSLKSVTGTTSNQQHWYDFQAGQNNDINILKQLYFDGNSLCNRVPTSSVQNVTADIEYSIPDSPKDVGTPKYYCNYMYNVQTYQRQNNGTIRVYFKTYNVATEKDYIRIAADGTEVGILSGQYGSAFYCLDADQITVTFQSKEGLVYNGYESHVKNFDNMGLCQDSLTGTKFIDVSHKYKKTS